MIKFSLTVVIIFLLGGCSFKNLFVRQNVDRYAIDYNAPLAEDIPEEMVTSEESYRSTMKPYRVKGRWYKPIPAIKGETFIGNASWYGPNFHGHLTSNGERYNMHKRTAAHKTLPINTYVKVTNLNNGLSTVVRINDRGPFVSSRIIDLSYQAAKEIGLVRSGVAPIKLEVLKTNYRANKYAVTNKPAKVAILKRKSNVYTTKTN